MQKISMLFFSILMMLVQPNASRAFDLGIPDTPVESEDFIPASEILDRPADDTQCATKAFADSLAASAHTVSETDDEPTIQGWIYNAFSDQETLTRVLACPEIANADDEDSIKFLPIQYTFPAGREIIVNYETQPKILKQRLALAGKKGLPDSNPSPRIGAMDDSATWSNTDPAWYAIMVVQAGTLDQFVGDGKNNTVSLKWVEDNIDTIYPHGYSCTSKSALANDNDTINQVVKQTVDIQDDTNDYYVAGDVNLQWITYLEVALDVAITVITFGAGTAIVGTTKAARAGRVVSNLTKSMRTLSKMDSVRDYIRLSQKYARAAEELKKIDKATDAARYATKADDLKRMEKTMRGMERADKNVRQYRDASKSLAELQRYRHSLRALRMPQRGNVLARAWRAAKAANTGGRTINRGAKVARAGMKSGRIRDWLFQATLKNAGKLGRMEQADGLLYGGLKLLGDMYDWTETSTGKYTSGVDFKPLCLLSADDIEGQENEVNHGMWLLWAGDSVSAADDDAAYLQAMDFAEKFHQDLTTFQSEHSHECDVDIYVVRPVIRNPGEDDATLYYLIMNDTPWTTKE